MQGAASLAACLYAFMEEGYVPLRTTVPLAEIAHDCLCNHHGLSPDFVSGALPQIATSLRRHIRNASRTGDPIITVRFEDTRSRSSAGWTLGVAVTTRQEGRAAPRHSRYADHAAPLEHLRSLRRLTSAGFEEVMLGLLDKLGCRDVVVTGRSGDGGIDLMARWPLQCDAAAHPLLVEAGLEALMVFVQAKRYRWRRVSKEEVQAFLTAMRQGLRAMSPGRLELPPAVGVIATSSEFTSGARTLCTMEGVVCIPGTLVARLLPTEVDSPETLR